MTGEQLILIGLVASAITLVLRVLATYGNVRPGRVVVNIFLYLLSGGLALAWTDVTFPTWPVFDGDVAAFAALVWQFINDLVGVAAPVFGTATLIYNLLYEKVVVPVWARFTKK